MAPSGPRCRYFAFPRLAVSLKNIFILILFAAVDDDNNIGNDDDDDDDFVGNVGNNEGWLPRNTMHWGSCLDDLLV